MRGGEQKGSVGNYGIHVEKEMVRRKVEKGSNRGRQRLTWKEVEGGGLDRQTRE